MGEHWTASQTPVELAILAVNLVDLDVKDTAFPPPRDFRDYWISDEEVESSKHPCLL